MEDVGSWEAEREQLQTEVCPSSQQKNRCPARKVSAVSITCDKVLANYWQLTELRYYHLHAQFYAADALRRRIQAQKAEEAWGREKKALMERLERLQKANKARRAELDDLTAQVLATRCSDCSYPRLFPFL